MIKCGNRLVQDYVQVKKKNEVSIEVEASARFYTHTQGAEG